MENPLTCNALYDIFMLRVTKEGVFQIAEKSRAEYMKSRRENQKTFSAVIERKKMESFEKKLHEIGKSKTEWLNEKIDEELSK